MKEFDKFNGRDGRTSDEIKKGLEICISIDGSDSKACCGACPYDIGCAECITNVMADALAYIQLLEAERDQYKRERDAAVETLKEIGDCKYCKHDGVCTINFPNCVECEKLDCACHTCSYRSNWQWRGVQEVE